MVNVDIDGKFFLHIIVININIDLIVNIIVQLWNHVSAEFLSSPLIYLPLTHRYRLKHTNVILYTCRHP